MPNKDTIKLTVITFILITVVGCSSIGGQVPVNPTVDVQPTISRAEDATKTLIPTNTPEPTETPTPEATKTLEKQPDKVISVIGAYDQEAINEIMKIPVASRDLKDENSEYNWPRDDEGNLMIDKAYCDDGTSLQPKCFLIGTYAGDINLNIGGGQTNIGLIDFRLGESSNYVRIIYPTDSFDPEFNPDWDKSVPNYYGNLDFLLNQLNKIDISPDHRIFGDAITGTVGNNDPITIGQLRAFKPLSQSGVLRGMPIGITVRITAFHRNDLSKNDAPTYIEAVLKNEAPSTQLDVANWLERVYLPTKLIKKLMQ
jgi:hypothetical protein